MIKLLLKMISYQCYYYFEKISAEEVMYTFGVIFMAIY